MTDAPLKIKLSEGRVQDGETGSLSLSKITTADGSQPVRSKGSSTEGSARDGVRSPGRVTHSTTPNKQSVLPKPSSPIQERPSSAIDPLSRHILKRTNTENTIPQKLRNSGTINANTSGGPDSPNAEAVANGNVEVGVVSRRGLPEPGFTEVKEIKEKKKGVSFLSRFSIIGGKKKDAAESVEDDESELGVLRTEGMNAHVFSSSVGANGYIPQHKEPPGYIKVRAHNKKEREFDRMFLAQELNGSKLLSGGEKISSVSSDNSKKTSSGGAIWATEFSKDGKYLAAAGEDEIVRVWSVISTADERRAHEHEEDTSDGHTGRLRAPVFQAKPLREFMGHTATVLDLSWSKNNFLLSSSMDKTVRLWHVSRQECLCTFKHKDFVTAIAFHPKDDRFFLAGSLDSVLRLWSIPDKSVAFWSQLPEMITAVAFTPDGKSALAGVFSGLCLFYETEGLKYNTQIHVRSSRGKNAKGSKITSIRTMILPPDDLDGETKILITSNDSRVRIYNFRDKTLEMKFRGHENTCSQIKASFSDDANYIICGSEDRKAFIWSMGQLEGENKDKRPLEVFEAHSRMVTCAIFAPVKTRQLLGGSGDPIYDLCNPPPVMLLSRAESSVSHEKRDSDPTSVSDPPKKPDEIPGPSPAYLERATHYDGNIIITADHSGAIKVFRQDCAFQKRRNDMWETGSTFSKKLVGRSNSIRTRNSAHSRRDSVTASQSSLSTQQPSDRILSWRDDIQTNSTSTLGGTRSDRSVSPGKFSFSSARESVSSIPYLSSSQPNLAQTARQMPYTPTTLHQQIGPSSESLPHKPPPPASSQSILQKSKPPPTKRTQTNNSQISVPSQPPTPGFSIQGVDDENNPLRIDAQGKSFQFWNVGNWRPTFGSSSASKEKGGNVPTTVVSAPGTVVANKGAVGHVNEGLLGEDLAALNLTRGNSIVSQLSSEGDSNEEVTEEGEQAESEGEMMACKRCGSTDFRAKKVIGGGIGSGMAALGSGGGLGIQSGPRLACGRCGLVVD